MQKLRISPEAAFSVNDWTAFVIFIVVIGGIGRMEGPLIGTIVFFLLRGFLADFGPWYFMLLGAVAIIVTLTMPKGIAGNRKIRSRPFPTSTSSAPPETEEQRPHSLCCGLGPK